MTTQLSMFMEPARLESGAFLSDDAMYRYVLWRIWGDGPLLLIVMLNPSTADATVNDPTIVRCIGFAKRESYGGIVVVNLYGFRATKPADLWKAGDPVGTENDAHIETACRWCAAALLAWGQQAEKSYSRKAAVKRILRTASLPLYGLGNTKAGDPRHPLMVRADQPFECVGVGN